jgi:hypothetical protein
LSSAVTAPATGMIYDLKGARLTKEHVISILQERDVPIQGAFIRGGLRPITQIAAIALRYSIKTHRSLPDDRIEVVGIDGELMFVVKGFALDEWNYSWGNDNEAVEEEVVAEQQAAQQVAQQEPAPAKWSRKKGEKSEKRLAIEAALQNGVTVKELVAEYGHTSAYFHNIGREIGVTFTGRGKWKRAPKGERATDSVVGPPPGTKRVSRFDSSKPNVANAPKTSFFPHIGGSPDPNADLTLAQLRAKRLAANTVKPSWRSRVGMFLRSVANRVEGSNA